MTQRWVRLVLIGGLAAVAAALCVYFLLTGGELNAIISTGAAAVLCLGLLFAYWRGWELARHVVTLIVAVVVAASLPGDVISVAAVLPAIFALALVDWRWVAGVGLAVLLVLMAKGNFQGAYSTFTALCAYLPTIGAAVMGGMALDAERLAAEGNARRAEAALALSDVRSAELAQQTALVNAQNARQAELLDLVSTLETPAVSIAPSVLLAPLVGTLDGQRADLLARRLLEQVHGGRVRLVIIDIAGVALVDQTVTATVSKIMQALRLLGCEVVLTGISASVATTLVSESAQLEELAVAASPEIALTQYWERLRVAA